MSIPKSVPEEVMLESTGHQPGVIPTIISARTSLIGTCLPLIDLQAPLGSQNNVKDTAP